MSNRREFIATISFMGTALAANQAMAQAAMLAETDAQAVALGYKADTKKIDAKKFPKHAATQTCTNCALYTGKASDKSGGCTLFPGKQVAGPGWCSAWVKKA
ncbi:MAG: high-potential iron-sulfur protein [Polaromonas sp.]|nr:high-potential iron-sulfur protein [Polaromonas sp.]